MRLLNFLALTAAAAIVAAAPAAAESKRDLDSAFKEQAGKILEYARAHDAKNIAVLKFLVRTGDGPWSDNAGPLNLNLARRLTVALILACPDDQIGIISNANEALANGKANHRDEEGRQECFRGRDFILAWGNPEIHVRPSLFITGTATLSPDFKTTTIHLQAFGKDGQMDDSLGDLTVNTSTRTLIDTGHSYLLTPKTNPDLFNGARGGDEADLDQPAIAASKKYSTDLGSDQLPSFDQDAPVRVVVYYGDEPIPVKNGAVREPKAGEKVWFKLDNLTDDTYGIVLKVNGVNSIFKEKFDDRDCKKWILKPHESAIVRGFQTKLDEREDFKVLPPEESRANEIRYGEFAGTFQVTAFRAGSGKSASPPPDTTQASKPPPPPPPPIEEKQAIAAISRCTLSTGDIQPGDLKSLQSQLRKRVQNAENGRGMLDGDPKNPTPHVVQQVDFSADPGIPVMSYRIRYYQRSDK
jgi:hypothetical protein